MRSQIDPDFGAVLREMRKRRKLSIEQTALAAEVHPVYYGKVERGEHRPTVEIVDRVLRALEISWTSFGLAVDVHRARAGRGGAARS
jgi:transcriptional regulator with XRE-family HTH domain